MSVTHVAGPVFHYNDRIIQRCACCGEKLADNLRVMMPLNPDGTAPVFPTWKERHLVHCESNRMTLGGDFADDNVLVPPDFCIQLVEA